MSGKYIWHTCIDCGKERWVQTRGGISRSLRCHSCANRITGKKRIRGRNSMWKGGRFVSNGYMYLLRPDHPKADPHGYVRRAILVLEAKLGRYVAVGCDVHHINGDRIDDEVDNLVELPHPTHIGIHSKERWKSYAKSN